MVTEATHLASGNLVVAIDDLTIEDLAHLLWIKRTEEERLRIRDETALERDLWRCICRMPPEAGASIAGQLNDGIAPAVVLAESFDHFYAARVSS
jgi:hypothetical protein